MIRNDSKRIEELLFELKKMTETNSEGNKLPGNVYYLKDGEILCCERENGNSRYPYNMDGMNLWINSNGYIEADDGETVILRKYESMEETSVEFWGGIKKDEKTWEPVSITGSAKQLFESDNIKRYTVFEDRCAYYICDTDIALFYLKSAVTTKKQIYFSVGAINKTNEEISLYLASFIELMLMESSYEGIYGKMNKYGYIYPTGDFKIRKNYLKDRIAVISRKNICEDSVTEQTVSKRDFLGKSGGGIANALSLKYGEFKNRIKTVNTSDWPVASDIIKFSLNKAETGNVSYLISFFDDEKNAEGFLNKEINWDEIENDIEFQKKTENGRLDSLNIDFGEISDYKINNKILNRFIKNIQKQTDLCAFGKTYVGNMLGMRDVFQQLETALIWDSKSAREKIVFCLGHIMTTGMSPRQFTVVSSENEEVSFDMREFIDQGLWIINAVYKYICYTRDYSLLSEECSYYEITQSGVEKSKEKGSVLEHLIRICDYFVRNIDEGTGCLRILYGDWNDALNGLGRKKDGNGFGTGVSVMATLQLYQAFEQINEILKKVEKYEEKCKEYQDARLVLEEGLKKHAVEKDGENIHILHGWGDNGSYNVGSTNDSDEKRRYSANSNSFWCISDMIAKTPELKDSILEAFEKLDSKYGIKTFEPYFPLSMENEVGSIVNLTPGTLEHAATYAHATAFAIIALFKIGEGEKAWKQIEKILPFTHKKLSHSPFVMPNSFFYNEEYHLDGESMLDWYTGSGTVLLRSIIENALGIQPGIDGLNIRLPEYLPSDNITAKFKIKDCEVNVIYKNKKTNLRKCFINKSEYNKKNIFISDEELVDKIIIEIID